MRILYFAPRACWPLDTGAKLRNWHFVRQLARFARVTYLSFEDGVVRDGRVRMGGCGPVPPAMTEIAQITDQVVTLARERPNSIGKILLGAVGQLPLVVLNYTTNAMRQELARVLEQGQFDAVQVEGVHLAGYLPLLRAARNRPLLLCDWHNIESEVLVRYSKHAPDPLRGLAASALASQLAALERKMLEQFDAHITVSERDRAQLLALRPDLRAFAVDNGVDVDAFAGTGHASEPAQRRRVVFVGSMDYRPNAQAIVTFARDHWPAIHDARPEWRLTVVGRSPRPEVRALGALPAVEVTGTVPDVRPYYADAIASVVPLRIGGGSRLKILEALAAGVPVISTQLGAEGLTLRDREHALVTQTVEELRGALLELDADQALRARLVASGQALVQNRYDWSVVGDTLARIYQQLHQHRCGVPAAPAAESLSAPPS
ncbi:glycosyltransferase family 4 protein [Sorangium sp. So ce693]|uniref:glycosyltransferase family 4 protein n=1 Tax=Sorangium sp. So ce693 TaxID=3133318 RepID=UPI003F603359